MQESRQVSIVAFKYPNQGVWLLFYNMTLLMANLEKFDSLDCKFLYVASIPDPLIERNNFFVQYQAGQTNLKLSTIARAKANEHAVYLTSANFPKPQAGIHTSLYGRRSISNGRGLWECVRISRTDNNV